MEAVQLDGKISWIVAVACASMNFFTMLPLKVSGLLFVQILDRYQVGRNLAGYPVFIMTLIRTSGGPLAGYFAERFGLNETLIVGSALAAVGISACFIAENIAAVIVFLGIIHGFGVAFTNTFHPVIMKLHFKKYVTLAYGMTHAGGSLGAFVTPPLLLWIFQNYGTSGGFLIMGGIVLNSLPIALILNILSPNRLRDLVNSKNSSGKFLKIGAVATVTPSDCKDNNVRGNIGGKEEKCVTKGGNNEYELWNSFETKAVVSLNLNRPTNEQTEVLPDGIGDVELSPFSEPSMNIPSERNSSSLEPEKNRMEKHDIVSENRRKRTIPDKGTEIATNRVIDVSKQDFKMAIPVTDSQSNSMADIFEENLGLSKNYTDSKSNNSKAKKNSKNTLKYGEGTIKDGKCSKENDSIILPLISDFSHEANCGNTQRPLATKSGQIPPQSLNNVNAILESEKPSNQEINQNKEQKANNKLPLVSTDAKYKAANKSLTLFLDITYWMVMISNAGYVFVLLIFWTTLIDFSRDKNIDKSKEAYLLMTLAISELLGRLGLGWITDGNYLTKTNFCILSFVGMGISCSIMAMAREFYVVIGCIFAYSAIAGGFSVVHPMMIFEFFEPDKHAMGQASKFSLFGPISFLSGPVIGYFRGTLGSYAGLYYTLAILSTVCAAVTALIPVLASIRDKKKKRQRS